MNTSGYLHVHLIQSRETWSQACKNYGGRDVIDRNRHAPHGYFCKRRHWRRGAASRPGDRATTRHYRRSIGTVAFLGSTVILEFTSEWIYNDPMIRFWPLAALTLLPATLAAQQIAYQCGRWPRPGRCGQRCPATAKSRVSRTGWKTSGAYWI